MNGYPQLNFDHGRISLEAETVTTPNAGFEVAALGHTGVQADLSVLFAHGRLVHELETLGYTEILAALRAEFEAGIESGGIYLIFLFPFALLMNTTSFFQGQSLLSLHHTPAQSRVRINGYQKRLTISFWNRKTCRKSCG